MPYDPTLLLYHVVGPCILQATVGAANAFAVVGVCEDGIDLSFQTMSREIKADGSGGPDGAPANYYLLNSIVIARCTLVPYAGAYLNKLRAAAEANQNGTPGTMVQSGTLYWAANGPPVVGNLMGVAFTSFDPDGGYRLVKCLVKVAGDIKASPDVAKPRFEFTCINAYDPSLGATILGNVLYTRI